MDGSNLNMYGAKMNPEQLKIFLEHIFNENDKRNTPGTPFVYGALMVLVKLTLQKLLPKIEDGSL